MRERHFVTHLSAQYKMHTVGVRAAHGLFHTHHNEAEMQKGRAFILVLFKLQLEYFHPSTALNSVCLDLVCFDCDV